MHNTQPQHTPLWQRYLATKAQSSAKYARDIAAEMGISEAELTEARQGYDAVRLQDDARHSDGAGSRGGNQMHLPQRICGA